MSLNPLKNLTNKANAIADSDAATVTTNKVATLPKWSFKIEPKIIKDKLAP